jgi:uncharacterized protein YukE
MAIVIAIPWALGACAGAASLGGSPAQAVSPQSRDRTTAAGEPDSGLIASSAAAPPRGDGDAAYWERYLEWKVQHQNLLRALDATLAQADSAAERFDETGAALARLGAGLDAEDRDVLDRCASEYRAVASAYARARDPIEASGRLKAIESRIRERFHPELR